MDGKDPAPQHWRLDSVRIASESRPTGLRIVAERSQKQGKARRRRRVLAEQALRWTYLLRSRQRWVQEAQARQHHQLDAAQCLDALGLDKADLEELAQAPMLVVRVPYRTENAYWHGRIFPWEYVLAAATRQRRLLGGVNGRPQPLTVIRELQIQTRSADDAWVVKGSGSVPLPAAGKFRVLFVNTLPMELREQWSADAELEHFRASLPDEVPPPVVLNYPSLDELCEAVHRIQPQLLHFAGMDGHQGLRELRTQLGGASRIRVRHWEAISSRPDAGLQPGAPARPLGLIEEVVGRSADRARALQWEVEHREVTESGEFIFQLGPVDKALEDQQLDGLLMRGADDLPELVSAQALAKALSEACAVSRPYLTTLNVWNSAARLAPLLVGEGASLAAVGFQDAFDDSLAEHALTLLWRHLFENGFDLPRAFQDTWLEVRDLPESVDATGVTLWVGAPVFVDGVTRSRHAAAPRLALPERPRSSEVLLEIEPEPELNYALLHNARPIFKRFVLACEAPEEADPVDIEVAVHMGQEVACYRSRVEMVHVRERLTDSIHVPLTAAVARSVHEAINTSLSVRVTQGERVLKHDSYRLRLLPVDLWRDNRRDGRWLPSFVLPRDPAVTQAISQARRYNRVLRDDPNAGFEGYQCVADGVPGEEGLRGVDRQVEAIWATLLHDWQLGYINPPPSYSASLDSQRLRMPSAIRAAGAGTCIDLALLFAACLEMVDIHPVIFLLEGHALAGWWRHWSYRDEFLAMRADSYSDVVEVDAKGNSAANAQVVSWHAGKASWFEVRRCIQERKLVPIETVRLTEHCGFVEAIEAGVQALAEKSDYDSMLDIVTARQAQVTPLPLLGDEA